MLAIMGYAGFLLLVSTIAATGAAGYHFTAALDEARPRFTPALEEAARVARVAIDVLIWDRSLPTSTRRKFFLSMVFGSLAAGCAALLMWRQGPPLGALLVGVVFILGAGTTFARWLKYRDRL